MCGFYGAIGRDAAKVREVQHLLSRLLAHRGPDDEGFEHGDGWALGFRRLSILDLSPAGHQPMSCAHRKHWLVLNGEIYNYVELRRELEKKGERFTGGSDTEVLLRLLMLEGTAALNKLNGMFAFAYVNTESRRFILARDRLGVKPLFLFRRNGALRFASELKTLLAWPDATREINTQALAEYLAVNYLPSELCIFKGYEKLGPAMYLAGSLDRPGEASPQRYWHLELNDALGAKAVSEQQLDELEALLHDATRIRLRSDVPVGVFLSGGIDSGLVATLAGRSAATKPLALTVAFGEEEYDESGLATQTALHAGLPQEVIRQSPGDLQMIDEIAWYYDEPFGDASALPTFMLCKAASAHATVFLSGDGGDEAFGGYRRYIEARRHSSLMKSIRFLRPLASTVAATLPVQSPLRYRLAKVALRDDGYAAAYDGIPNDPVLTSLAGPALGDTIREGGKSLWVRWNETGDAHLLTRQQRLDFSHYLPDDILVKVDRASMAHSIEVRSPFLDYRVVEWAARLPRSVMLNGERGKLPLRALAGRLLPANVERAEKRGFGVPLDEWFRNPEGRHFVEERLLSPRALERGWWTGSALKNIMVAHSAHRGRHFGGLLWRLLMLDAWARYYADGSLFLKGVCFEEA
jgi:asparagine synthase (glutamine-hydrolysing)